jgi:hypothetical protein
MNGGKYVLCSLYYYDIFTHKAETNYTELILVDT